MGLETEKYGDLEIEFIAYGCHTNMSYKNRFIGSDDGFIKDDGFESLKKGLDDIERCYLYRDFLNDVKEIKTTINVKLNAGVEYDFPAEFVFNQFDYLIREIQNDIKSIYIDYGLKAFREGRAFYKPLPDNSYVNNPQPCEKEVANPLDKHDETGNNNTLMQVAENTNTTNEHLAIILQYFEKWDTSQVIKEKSSDYKQNAFMIILETKSKKAYKALNKAISIELVRYENGKFDFRCSKGSTGLFFLTADYTEWKTIAQFITIKKQDTTGKKLKNAYGNTAPKDWKEIEKTVFTT